MKCHTWREKKTEEKKLKQKSMERKGFGKNTKIVFNGLSRLYGTAESRIFHQTPAGHTAERKTRRKRNRGC
jgi:hypothetical protein